MLDLNAIAGSVGLAAAREVERRSRGANQADQAAALAAAQSADTWEPVVARLRVARTSWLSAHSAPDDPIGSRHPVVPAPDAYVVVASDGSQIAPDRHEGVSAACWLLNVGRVRIGYGDGAPRPLLASSAEVMAVVLEPDGDNADDEDEVERQAARGLAARRFAREMAALTELAADAATTGLPAVAMTDGPLIAWALYDEEGNDPAKQEALAALRDALEATRKVAVPIAGYVSGPGSRDVVNALRIGVLCPEEPADCLRCPHPKAALPCAPIRHATDAALFERLLSPGERSAVFSSQGQKTGFSRILPTVYGPVHWAAFFYLHVGAEIVRIELPAWAAEDGAVLDRVHAVCLDQAVKGRGYPVALAEAHEAAVVRAADRAAFLNLLRRHLVQAGSPEGRTRKALAKQARAI
jgi:hypothetical protein